MSRTSVPQPEPSAEGEPTRAASTPVHLPNPPIGVPRRSAGETVERARQAAERGITSGAVDAPTVEAIIGDLPGEAMIAEDAAIEHAGLTAEAAESRASGETLLEGARRGSQVAPSVDAETTSVDGLRVELAAAEKRLARVIRFHKRLRAVLRGERPADDGTHRAGEEIAPHAIDLRRRLRIENLLAALPVTVPLIVEGGAVTFNMHAYLRADDANWALPVVIAVITVGVVTFAPYLLGRAMNDVVAGRRLLVVQRILLGLLAGFWVVVGVALALVRVQVDQHEAVRAAEAQRATDVRLAQSLGKPVDDIPEVDPVAVFDPVVPTVFWIAVFLGFGVALLWWECSHRNPVRMQELRARIARGEEERRVAALTAQLAAVEGSVALQERVNGLAAEMWKAEGEVIDAVAARAEAEYHAALGEASGDPAMPLAIDRHRRQRLAQGGDR